MSVTFQEWLSAQEQEIDFFAQIAAMIRSRPPENRDRLSHSALLMEQDTLATFKHWLAELAHAEGVLDADDSLDQRLAAISERIGEESRKIREMMDECPDTTGFAQWRMRRRAGQIQRISREICRTIETIRLYIREHDADQSVIHGTFHNADDLIRFLDH